VICGYSELPLTIRHSVVYKFSVSSLETIDLKAVNPLPNEESIRHFIQIAPAARRTVYHVPVGDTYAIYVYGVKRPTCLAGLCALNDMMVAVSVICYCNQRTVIQSSTDHLP
jgi:hypothetical protein